MRICDTSGDADADHYAANRAHDAVADTINDADATHDADFDAIAMTDHRCRS